MRLDGARRAAGLEHATCTEKNGKAVDFYLHLAAALVTLRLLIRRATSRYRWDGRPASRIGQAPARQRVEPRVFHPAAGFSGAPDRRAGERSGAVRVPARGAAGRG